MKKMMLMVGALAMLAATTSCSSSSKAPRKPQTDMVEQVLPLSGPEYRSDADYYRAVQSGISPEQSMAKKIAMQNARQEIAAAVQTDIATVMENYAKSQKLPSQTARSYEERVTELTYAIVKQSVSGMTLVDEKLFKEANGDYRHYVCMQLSKSDMKQHVLDEMQKDEKLMSDFEFDQFKKLYEQKLSEYSQQ